MQTELKSRLCIVNADPQAQMNLNECRVLLLLWTFWFAMPVALADRWRVIDENGRTIVPEKYEWIDYKNGRFELCVKRGAWGGACDKVIYADSNGNIVPTAEAAKEPANDGKTLPKDDGKFLAMKDGRYTLLDKAGNKSIVFPEGCTQASLPQQLKPGNLICCGFGGTVFDQYAFLHGSKWGYCDINGRIVIEPKFAWCNIFVGDLAIAYLDSTDDDLVCGIINKRGEWILPAQFDYIKIVTENRFIVREPRNLDEKWKGGSKRWELFGEYLRLHDFIGMSKQQLCAVFPDGESIAPYDKKDWEDWAESIHLDLTPGSSCGNASAHVLFGLDKSGKVFGWRIGGGSGADHSWVKENVVLQNRQDGLGLTNLAPKLY